MKTRRDFLKFCCKTSLAATLSPLLLPGRAAAATPAFDDYKALVYISLSGGNDAFNMFMPTATEGVAGHDNFVSNRGPLAVLNTDISDKLALAVNTDGDLDFTGGNPYKDLTDSYRGGMYHIPGTGVGVNALMPELAHMINQGKAAGIMSVGTLVEPVMDPVTNTRMSGRLVPPYLFSHNSQRRLQEKGIASKSTLQGWVGRLFDAWPGVNDGASGLIKENISFAGNSFALRGDTNAPLVLPGFPTSYKYINSAISDAERAARIELAGHVSTNLFKEYHRKITAGSFTLADEVQAIWDSAPVFSSTNAYGEPLMSNVDSTIVEVSARGDLMAQLNDVLKMLKYGRDNGLKRQVFYVKMKGFDDHGNQTVGHPKHLRGLSMALYAFQKATEELGLGDKVTAFTLSDFGRSVGGNSDGTDHAWAGHNIVVGGAGALNSGKFYGELPNWNKGGPQDISGRGRIIPTISVEQQLATITRWFGADDALNETVFPNLSNFITNAGQVDETGRDLGFMKTV